ncbi:MAG TPA: hypothetical protein VM574_07920 [Terrimicrobiaceae bacterium]|jgi:hypothetical protein|nr:hypothetical protein [Terrimicrobiaceae bacterium]
MAKPQPIEKRKVARRSKRQAELQIEGPGVSPLHLPEVDDLAQRYIKERDKRLIQTPKEVAAKRMLIDALHNHEKEITQPDGQLVYRYDEMKITLIPGKEKLRVEEITTSEPE